MAVNMSNYIKNLGKSVGYSAIDKVKKMNPAIVNMTEANADLTKDLYKGIKNYKAIVKNIPKAIRENEYYKIAEQGLHNTLEDLKSGKFYNKERIDKTNLKMMGITEDDMSLGDIDIDFSLEDDDYGLGDLDLDSIGDDDIFLANQIDEVGSKTSNAIAASTAESARYIANTNKASTKMLIDQNNKMMSQINIGMGAINTSINQMVQFQEQLQTHIENSTKFYENIGGQIDTTNQLLSEILELQKKNASFNIREEEKKRERIKYSDIDDAMGGVDLKQYAASVKKRLNSQTGGIFDMLNSFSGGNMLETMIASPLQFISDKVVDKMVSKTIEESSEALNKSLQGFFGSLMARLNYDADNAESEGIRKLAEIFGVDNRLKRNIDVSKYTKGPIPFNGKANKAITEVIPTQLSEIISILSGTSQQLFNYETGRFTNREAIRQSKINDMDREGIGAGSEVLEELREMLREISFANYKDRENIEKEMKQMFKTMFREGSYLDIYNNDFELPGVNDPTAKKYIRSMLKQVSRNKMLTMNSEMMSRRDRFTRNMEEKEASGVSEYNYLEDGFISGRTYKASKDGRGREVNEKNDTSLLSKLSIDRIKDDKGHNIFYYLQNINSELTYMRNNGIGGVGSGRGAGTAYYYPTGVIYNNDPLPEYSSSIVNDSPRDRDLDRDYRDQIRYMESREKELEKNPNLIKSEDIDLLDDKEFDKRIAGAAQAVADRKNNPKYRMNLQSPKGVIDELLAAKTITEKSKVIVDNIKSISSQPSKLLASAMDSADRALYTIIYGDKRDKDGKRKSFLNEMIDQMKYHYTRLNTWLDTEILIPLKEKLKVDQFRDIPNKIFKDLFGVDLTETKNNFKEFLFGVSEIDGNGNKIITKEGLFTPIFKGIEEAFDDTGKFLDEALSPILDPLKDKFKGTTKEDANADIENEIEIDNSIVSTSSVIASNVSNKYTKGKQQVEDNKNYQGLLANTEVVTPDNSYKLAGGFFGDIDYKDIPNKIKAVERIKKNYNNRKIEGGKIAERRKKNFITILSNQITALNIEYMKFKDFSALFAQLIKHVDHDTIASLFLNSVGSKGINCNTMTLEEIYEELQKVESSIDKESKVKRHAKNLVNKFNEFADYAPEVSLDTTKIRDRNNTKISDVRYNTKDININDLRDMHNFINKSEDTALPSNATSKISRSRLEIEKDISEAFNSVDIGIGEGNGILKELKSIHRTLFSIYRSMEPYTPSIPGERGFIGPLENMATGGVVDYPEDTVIPTLLSGGEIVINPADDKTKKQQGIREKKVLDLFRKGKVKLLSEGTENEDEEFVPLDELEEIEEFKRKKGAFNRTYKKYMHNGEIYVKSPKGKYYYRLEDFEIYGERAQRYYRNQNDEMLPVEKREKGNRISSMIKSVDNGEYVEGEEPFLYQMGQTLSNGIKSTSRAIGITKDDSKKFEKAVSDVIDNIGEYAPAAIGSGLIGSGVSLVTGAIGGPLLGAAAGAAIGLVRKSDKVQTWLFGDIDENGEYDGGFLSKDLSNNIHKYLPGMAKSATLGGIVSILPFVPGGPMAGIMLGSAIGYAKENEEFMSTIFGENYKENIGSFKEKIKDKLPNIALGAIGGGLFGPLGGVVPNIVLGSALGFATTTEKFNELLFGELQEDGTREGGILNAVKVGIVDPIKENGKALWGDIKTWVHDDIIDPIHKSIDPLFKQSFIVMNKVFGGIFDKISNSFDRGFAYVVENFLRTGIFNPVLGGARKVGGFLYSPVKNAISLPFRAVGKVGDYFRGRQVAKGNATYMNAQERLDYRSDKRQKRANGLLGKIGTGINRIANLSSNPLSTFLNNRSAIRGDDFEEFDRFLANASDVELGQMRDQFKLITDTNGYLNEERAEARKKQRKDLYFTSGLNYIDASNIEEYLNSDNYEGAKRYIDGLDYIDELDKQKLLKKIFTSGAKYNAVKEAVSNLNSGRTSVLKALRSHSSGAFKGLKSTKDLTKYQDYLTKEINNRKDPVKEQTEQQKEHHKEIMSAIRQATSLLQIIANPDANIRAKQLQALENKEMIKAANAANTKGGLFSNFGIKGESARLFDYKRDANGEILRDEFGNPLMDYIGYGSMSHAERNKGMYETTTYIDSNGNEVQKLVLDNNGNPILKDGMKPGNRARLFNTLHHSRNYKKDLFDKYSKQATITDMIEFNNLDNASLKSMLTGFAGKYNIVNQDIDRLVTSGMTNTQMSKLLDDMNYSKWSRKDREKFSRNMSNRINLNNSIRHYINEGYSTEEATELANNDIAKLDKNFYTDDNGKKRKKKWYIFEGAKRYRIKYDQDGTPQIDNEDAETSENVEELDRLKQLNKDTYSSIVNIKNTAVGFVKRFFGISEKDSDKKTIWDKFKITGGKIMGAWTLLSFMPKIKQFWSETVSPFLGDVLSPIEPTIERLSLKLDNFFMNTVPNTLKSIGNNIIWWLSGTGKFSNSGLPGLFRDKIVPFYMGGIEFVTEDIIPTIFKYLPNVLTSVAKGAVKSLANILSINIANLLRGEVPTLDNTEVKDKLDKGIFKSNDTKKTGFFYNIYRSMFGSKGGNITESSQTEDFSDINSNYTLDEKANNIDSKFKSSLAKASNLVFSSDDEEAINKLSLQSTTNTSNVKRSVEEPTSVSNNSKQNKSLLSKASSLIFSDDGEEEAINQFISQTSSTTNTSKIANLLSSYGLSQEDVYVDEDGLVNDSVPQYSQEEYNNLLSSMKDGDAIMDANGNLIYASEGDYILQDSTGQTYSLSEAANKYNGTIIEEKGKSNKTNISTKDSIIKALKSFADPGTVGYASGRSFLTGNAGLFSKLGTFLDGRKGKLLRPKGTLGKIAALPINKLANGSLKVINAGANAGNNMRSILNGTAVQPSSLFLENSIQNKLLNSSDSLYKIISDSTDETMDYMKNVLNKTDDELEKLAKNVSDEAYKIAKNNIDNSGNVAIKKSFGLKMSLFLKDSKITWLLRKAFGESAFKNIEKALIEMSEGLADTVWKRLTKKTAAKAASFVGRLTPAAIAFIVADGISGWTNAQANLGILREPTFVEKLVSMIVTILNNYFTLGVFPETLIYQIVIDALSPFIDSLESLQEEREAAKREVAKYNTKMGTDYTVSEYINKDNTHWWNTLLGNHAVEKSSYNVSTMTNYSLSKATVSDKSSIIGGTLSQAQLAYAKQNGIYASGSGILTPPSSNPNSPTNSMLNPNPVVKNMASNKESISHVPDLNNTFISQNDSRLKDLSFKNDSSFDSTTVGTSGCVPLVSAMIAKDMEDKVSTTSTALGVSTATSVYANEALNMASSSKYKLSNNGVKTSFIKDYLAKHDIEVDSYDNSKKKEIDLSTLKDKVKAGHKVAVIGKDTKNKSKSNSPFGPNPHAVKIRGIKGDKFIVDDPEQLEGGALYNINDIYNGMIEAYVPKLSASSYGSIKRSGITKENSAKIVKGLTNFAKNPISTVKSLIQNSILSLPNTQKISAKAGKEEIEQTMYNTLDIAILFGDICTFSTISRSTFKKTLEKFLKGIESSALSKTSDYFLIASQESGIDPRILLSVALTMTDYGTNKFAKTYKNPFKIKNSKDKYVKFKDIADGIIEGAKYIKTQMYINAAQYCLKQLSISGDGDIELAGKIKLELYAESGSLDSVIAILLSKEMPDNTKFAPYTDGPTNTTTPSANISGELVYNKGKGEINSISDITSMFTKLANAIFGFSTEEDPYGLDSLVDGKDGENYLKSNGHTFMCYCEECHPEMYDKDHNPITPESMAYTMTSKYGDSSNPDKLQEATVDMANQIYETLVEQIGFSKNLDPIKIMNSGIEYQKAPGLANMMSKFMIMASEDRTVPGITLAKKKDGESNAQSLLDMQKPYDITTPYLNYDSVFPIDEDMEKRALDLNIKDKYATLLWYYKNRFKTDYTPRNTVLKNSYNGTDNAYKQEIEHLKDAIAVKLGIKKSNYSDRYEFNKKIYSNLKENTNGYFGYGDKNPGLFAKKTLNRITLEKTDSFNPDDIIRGRLTLYPVSESNNSTPLYYLGEAKDTSISNHAFKTSLMGVPIYGVNTTSRSKIQESYNKSYLSGFGHELVNQFTRTGALIGDKLGIKGAEDYVVNRLSEYDVVDKSWKDVTAEDMVNIYGLPKAKGILDQFSMDLAKAKEDATTDIAETSSEVTGVYTDTTAQNVTDTTSVYKYDKYGNLINMPLSSSDLSVQEKSASGSGLKLTGSGSFVSQVDPRYADVQFNTSKDSKKQTLGEAGCAPAVATMAINNYLGKGTNMLSMANSALNYKVKDGGTSSDYFGDVFAQNGISSSYTENRGDIINSLKNGNSVVLLGQDGSNRSKSNSPFGPGSHYVLANGISNDGRTVYINDPEADRENIPYSSRILNNTNLGITVGGSSGIRKYSKYNGLGTYTKETASIDKIRSRNLGMYSTVTAEQLNAWINPKVDINEKSSGVKSIMRNTGEYFIKAANQSGLDPRYLVAHAGVETGWGTSRICRTKYNFFGISAFDTSPYTSAKKWNGVEMGIINGAIWIATNYYQKGQTTLYTMRHNNGKHQYATDPFWDKTIAQTMQTGPINESYSESSEILSNISKEIESNIDPKTGEYIEDSNGDIKFSGISNMISSVFTKLGNAIFGFSNEEEEDISEDLSYQESTSSVVEYFNNDSEMAGENEFAYITLKTNLYKYLSEPYSGAPEGTKHIIQVLKQNTKVKVISRYKSGDSAKVKVVSNGNTGYVKSSLLGNKKTTSSAATKKKDFTTIRDTKLYKYSSDVLSGAPDATKVILTTIKSGEKFKLVTYGKSVCKITYKKNTGYARTENLNIPNKYTDKDFTNYTNQVARTRAKTNLYQYLSEPYSGAPEATKHLNKKQPTLEKGTQVNLLSSYKLGDSSKVKVLSTGNSGYVKTSNLELSIGKGSGLKDKYISGGSSTKNGFRSKTKYYSPYAGRSNINTKSYSGSGIEEILEPFTKFGRVFGFSDESSTTTKSSTSKSSTKSYNDIITKSKYSAKYKYNSKFTFTNNTYSLSNKIVNEAKKHLGKPYKYGAVGPNTFDCSGFCKYVYAKCGINLANRTSYNMATDSQGKVVTTATIGDLVFFGSSVAGIHHVGIYIGNGQYIHAPKTGDVVKISNLDGRRDLVRIKHYATSSGKGSGLSLVEQINKMANPNSDMVLNDYLETKYGNGSKIVKPTTTVQETRLSNRSGSDNSAMTELVKLCCKYMANTANNTDLLKDILTVLKAIKESSGKSTASKSGKGSEVEKSSNNTVILNNTNNNVNNSSNNTNIDLGMQEMIEMLSKLASD